MADSDDCVHPDFVAFVDISRMFPVDVPEEAALQTLPDSLAITLTANCVQCNKAVRFEGPTGVAVGPGAPPMVSFNGLELRAAGHLGENRTPAIRVTMQQVPACPNPRCGDLLVPQAVGANQAASWRCNSCGRRYWHTTEGPVEMR